MPSGHDSRGPIPAIGFRLPAGWEKHHRHGDYRIRARVRQVTSFWTDSRQTRMSVRQSRDRFDGEQVVLYSRSLDADGNEKRRTRRRSLSWRIRAANWSTASTLSDRAARSG